MKSSIQRSREAALEQNAALLDQAVEVLSVMDDASYSKPNSLFDGQRIGAQIRHVLEFYECLFDGLSSGYVNYDARRRDPQVEANRAAAIARLEAARNRLLSDPMLRKDDILWTASEGSADASGQGSFVLSSVARELQAVETHTVHHFAIIAMLLRHAGIPVPSNFGVSRATLMYWAAGRDTREAA
jgi:hypothetical protein